MSERKGCGLIELESGQYATEAKPGGGVGFVRSNSFLRNAMEGFPVPVRFE